MKNYFKKIASIFVSLCIVTAVVAVSGRAVEDSGFCGNGVAWSYDDSTGELEISGIGRMFDYSKTSAPWYRFRNSISSVVINNGVENIGSFAFYGLNSVADFNLPASVKEVGECAFDETLWMKNSSGKFINLNGILIKYQGDDNVIRLPQNITSIGSDAFKNNQTVTEISSDYFIDTVSSSAFLNCTNLQKVRFNNLKKLCQNVFSGCTSLSEIIVSDSVEFIGSSCFEDTPWLKNNINDFATVGNILVSYKGRGGIVEIPDGITGIADAFSFNDEVATVYIPNSVKYIGKNAFYSCENLSCVVFGENIETIGENAFWGCTEISELFLPTSLEIIENNAFENCYALITVSMQEGVEKIGDYAFASCSSVEEVKLPSSLRTLGNYAFLNCDYLKTVVSDSRLTVFGTRSIGYSMLGTGIEKNHNLSLCGADNSTLHDYALDNTFEFRTDNCVHNFKSTHISPACDLFGYDYQKCTRCGYYEISNISQPSDHIYFKWFDNGEFFERKCSSCAVNEYDGGLYGDLDRDGIVNGMDSTLAKAIAEKMNVTDKKEILPIIADCNRNGTVDETDIDLIIKSGLFLAAITQNR